VKFSVSKNNLVGALGRVSGVVSNRTLPILANVLLQAKDNTLSVTGTDLELELSSSCQADVVDAGVITVPARKLLDISRALPDGDIKMSLDEAKLTLAIGPCRYVLSTLPGKEYPSVDVGSVTCGFSVDSSTLLDLFARTSFAMANSDVRHYLNGALLEITSGQLRVVATDGHRLAVCDHPAGVDGEGLAVILPRKAVSEITRLFGDGVVSVSIGESFVRLEGAEITLVSKLIDGKFPDYNRVLPKGLSNTLVGDRQALMAAFSRAGILSHEQHRGIKLQPGADSLAIETSNPESECATDQISISFSGESFEIGFNVNYLTDALRSLTGSSVQILMGDAGSSVLISDPDSNTRHDIVVMPMRV
jgi:DNA polymerase-3 subunit beta